MAQCADCKKHEDPLMVRGVSQMAGGEYYNGAGLCEECIAQRREAAIVEHEFRKCVRKGTIAWAGVPDDFIDELRGGASDI